MSDFFERLIVGNAWTSCDPIAHRRRQSLQAIICLGLAVIAALGYWWLL